VTLAALLGGAALAAGACGVSGIVFAQSIKESQSMSKLPQPILAFFQSSNRGDAAGVVACFTPDAILNDWGRQFEGHAGVASWDRTDNTGVQSHLDAIGAEAMGDAIVVTVKVSGKGFNGTGRMHFRLAGDKIARLDIK